MEIDKLKIVSLRLSARMKHVILPIHWMEFLNSLQKSGYQISQIPTLPPTVDIGTASVSGTIARKLTCIVDANSERQFIGVQESRAESLVEYYKDVMSILHDLTESNPLQIWFTEFQGRFTTQLKANNSLGTMKELGKSFDFLKNWEGVIGEPIQNSNIKVTSSGKNPDSPDYFEMTLQPYLIDPLKTLEIVVIMRSPNGERVESFAKGVETNISAILTTLR